MAAYTSATCCARLEPLVAFPRETLEARYRFRPDQALHVIARAHVRAGAAGRRRHAARVRRLPQLGQHRR